MRLAPQHLAARLGIAFVACAGVAVLAPRAHAEDWTKSYSISGRAQVRVNTNDGAVQIYTGDSKQVEFRVIYDGFELNKNLHIDSRQDGDSVQINARVTGHWGFSWGKGRRIKVEVHMPKDADLQVDTGDGSVDTQSLKGKIKIHTGDGSVRAQAVSGDVDIDTGVDGITARTPNSAWTNIEGGHTGRPQLSCGDRDDTTARTQIQHPSPLGQLGPFQCVDQQ